MPSRPIHPALSSALLLATLLASSAHADAVQLRSADDRGVTFDVRLDRFELSAPGPNGRVRAIAPGFSLSTDPGRAMIPFSTSLIAVPPGARVTARVIAQSAEEAREGVRVAIAERPAFERGGVHGEERPVLQTIEPIRDGVWPPNAVEVGAPFQMRGQHMVAVTVRPVRYDEATGRLLVTRSISVRVDFARGAAASAIVTDAREDRHFEPVLRSTVLNYESGRAWRESRRPAEPLDRVLARRPAPLSARGVPTFDETNPEVRVQVDTTGLYALDPDELEAKGLPAGIPIAEVSVHRHEFVENANPPYVTIELPIEVQDYNRNGVFDSGDAIWVVVQNWAERSGVGIAQRVWGDAEMIYVTRKSTGGLRMRTRDGWRNQAGPTLLSSYPFRRKYEKNFAAPMLFPFDTTTDVFQWTEIGLYYERPDTIRFEANHIDTTHAATFAITWQGRNNNAHYLWAQVKNGSGTFTSICDSVGFFGKIAFTQSRTLFGSSFSEGLTNTMRFWGKNFQGPPDPVTNAIVNVGLNDFVFTYWRRYRAVAGYLDANSADATGEIQIRATGLRSDSLRIYDATDPQDPVRLVLDPAHIFAAGSEREAEFQDSIATGQRHQYFVASDPKFPPSSQYSAVIRRQLSASGPGDYLLIVPEAFLPAVQPLVTLRQSQGLGVRVAPLESVNDEFNGGRHSPHSIRRYVDYAYRNWGARFVVLMGDGSQDPRNFGKGAGTDWIPVQSLRGPVPVSEGLENVPSDGWYGCLTGNCDPLPFSGPGEEVLIDVYIGRLPVNSLAEANAVVDKLVAYDDVTTGDPSWRRKVLLFADDEYSGESTFGGGGGGSGYCHRDYENRFRLLDETISNVILEEALLRQTEVELFNESYWLRNEPFDPCPCVPDTCRPDRAATSTRARASITPALFQRLNEGRVWWNYQGHANEFLLAHEQFYSKQFGTNDVLLFQNDGKPTLFSAFSCHANQFARANGGPNDFGPSIGEEMVTLGNRRGAIASWASTAYEVIPRDGENHINVDLARAMFSTPPFDEYLGDRGSRVVLGEAIATALLRYISRPDVQGYTYERGIALTYELLGDPATRISIGRPQAIVTANGQPVQDGQTVRLRVPGDTLHIEADLVSSVRLDSLALFQTSGTTTTRIPPSSYTLTPAFPDTAAGAVYGGRRFHLSYATPLTAASFSYRLSSWDRYGLQGDFVIPFQFESVLRAEGSPIGENDAVSPTANLSLLLLSPKPIVDPLTELTLTINGTVQAFQAVQAPGDTTRHEWILSWTHSAYPIDTYEVMLSANGGATNTHHFRVTIGGDEIRLENVLAFPNPFEDDLGTFFSFSLLGGDPADLKISVFTVSGRLVYTRVERGLAPGYHQIAWDGRDAEGDKLANGVYLYRVIATNSAGSSDITGRLVKLRKPRRVEDTAATTTP